MDKQRRFAIPKEWRQDGNVFYLLPGRDHSVQILPEEIFEEEVFSKAKNVSFASRSKSNALANLGKFTHKCVCDGQGRISLTKLLMQHARLEEAGSVELTGSFTRIELKKAEKSNESLLDGIEEFLDIMEAIHEQCDS